MRRGNDSDWSYKKIYELAMDEARANAGSFHVVDNFCRENF